MIPKTKYLLKLSIIIVNYNVRYFLEQALGSVRKAVQGIEHEVFVVDNNSVDDSVQMVKEKFPEVKLIANTQNTGFATANNQAIRISTGEYVLLLNPDTLVEEDTFHKCIAFMDAHPNGGALGVRLIDGSGKYLPESKRGFPTPWVAFCKTVGLSAIFPRSKTFNGYYLGHLSEHQTHEVDVLVGAFMFMRKTALDKAGLLDEAFFMYGEDIDLSYRVVLAGYKNYYLAETSIIHYKGESTKKGSLNYVRTFYQAMIIFAKKHFSGGNQGLYVNMLQAAIWLRAGLTLSSNLLKKLGLPLLDAAIIVIGLFFLKDFWANYFYKDPNYYKPSVVWFNFPLYTCVWLLSVWLNGGYDNRFELRRLLRGLAMGTILLAAIYGFLDMEYRSSRALLLLGALWAAASTIATRILLHFAQYKHLRIGKGVLRNLAIVGSNTESLRVQGLLHQSGVHANLIGTIAPHQAQAKDKEYLCSLEQIEEAVRVYKINEIIFCSRDVRAEEIMRRMTALGPFVSIKIVPEESISIIGSSSKNEPGELYTIAVKYNIAEPGQARNKRVFDLVFCLSLLIFFPFWLIFSSKASKLYTSWFSVFWGRRTWVGYHPSPHTNDLPRIKPGILTIAGEPHTPIMQHPDTIDRLNYLYAKDWSTMRDLEVLLKSERG